MAWGKIVLSQLLVHWGYHSLEWSHWKTHKNYLDIENLLFYVTSNHVNQIMLRASFTNDIS